MKPNQLPLVELLYEALHAEWGIKVRVISPSVELFRAKLYAARREAQEHTPEMADLAIWASPINPNDLWIGKKHGPDNRA